jgi:CHASE3 domain sensor protein
MAQYDTAVTQFHQSIAGTALDTSAVDELSRFMDDRAARADASLKELAGTLAAGGNTEAAAAVARTQSHVDQSWRGSKHDLQSRGSASQRSDHQQKPAGGEP